MSNLQNNINTYANTTAYNADLNKDYPNVSYIQGTDEVKIYKYDPDHIVAVYNVTSTSSATKLLNSNSSITYQIIDGVQQQSIQTTYTFDTLGEHTVKYKLSSEYLSCSFGICTNLTSMIMPNNILGITSSNFCYGCTSLTNVKLSDNLNYIGDGAFWNCSGLTSITIKATTPPTLGSYVLQNTNANLVIYVPAESVDTYKAASGWSSYASRIQAIPTT